MNLNQVIKKPIITEKSTEATSFGRYAFEVDKKATKGEIKRAMEKFFEVKALKVWTSVRPKKGKKAIVQLAEGQKIDLFKSGE